jgi:hypothetical protein
VAAEGARRKLTTILALGFMASAPQPLLADDHLAIFDTHLHYSQDAWATYGPEAIVEILETANVVRALVSSTPDLGTLKLYRHDPARFVPILRPYRAGVGSSIWHLDPETPAYLAERLELGVHRGIGEFHLFDDAATTTPVVRQVAAMAVARGIVLHVHADAGPVRALFEIEPGLTILWAHAGMSAPPAEIGALLERYPRLIVELSFRAGEIAPGGRLDPAWRELFTRHPERFMIGSDTYVTPRWGFYPAIIDEHRRWLALLPAPLAKAIAQDNAARVFGAGGPATVAND